MENLKVSAREQLQLQLQGRLQTLGNLKVLSRQKGLTDRAREGEEASERQPARALASERASKRGRLAGSRTEECGIKNLT